MIYVTRMIRQKYPLKARERKACIGASVPLFLLIQVLIPIPICFVGSKGDGGTVFSPWYYVFSVGPRIQ